eukprot:scaffold124979_cov41-Cyclotella_meneghiniana.AAC.4
MSSWQMAYFNHDIKEESAERSKFPLFGKVVFCKRQGERSKDSGRLEIWQWNHSKQDSNKALTVVTAGFICRLRDNTRHEKRARKEKIVIINGMNTANTNSMKTMLTYEARSKCEYGSLRSMITLAGAKPRGR